MFLKPKVTNYKKYHKGKVKLETTFISNRYLLRNGDFGLKSMESGRITARHIETFRRIIKRFVKRSAKLWITIFPHLAVTSKPNENRMGKGKGKVSYHTAVVKPGDVIVELSGMNAKMALKVLKSASRKLPVLTNIVILNR